MFPNSTVGTVVTKIVGEYTARSIQGFWFRLDGVDFHCDFDDVQYSGSIVTDQTVVLWSFWWLRSLKVEA